MTTQGVVLQTFQKADIAKRDIKKKADSNFESYMSKKEVVDHTKPKITEKVTSKEKEMIQGSVEKESTVAISTKQDTSEAKHSEKKASKKESTEVEDKILTESTTDVTKIDSVMLAEAITIISDIIKDEMQLSEEELESLLSQMGMQVGDLLQQDNLKMFLLQANGKNEFTEFLTNEPLNQQFNQLMEQLDSVDWKTEFGVSKEELGALLEQWKQTISNPFVNDLQVSNKTFQEVLEDSSEAVDELLLNQSIEGKELTITVKTENGSQSFSQAENKPDGSFLTETQKTTELNNQTHLDTFIQNLTQVTEVGDVESVTKAEQMREIVTQVVEQIKITVKPDTTGMEIQLNPENLGKVNLSVVLKDGAYIASFVVQNEIAKEALQNQLHLLKDSLEQQGIKVEAMEVTVSEFGFEQSKQSNENEQGSKKAKKQGLSMVDEDIDTEDEIIETNNIVRNGNNINFTA